MKTSKNKWKFILGGIMVAVAALLIAKTVYRNGNYRCSWIHNERDGSVTLETDYYVLSLPASWRNHFEAEIGPSDETFIGDADEEDVVRDDNYRLTVSLNENGISTEIAAVEMYSYGQDAYALDQRWDAVGRMYVTPIDTLYSSWYVFLLLEYPDDEDLTQQQQSKIATMQAELLAAVKNIATQEDEYYYSNLSVLPANGKWQTWEERYKEQAKAKAETARREAARTATAPAADLHKCMDCSNLVPIGVSYCENHACLARGGCNSPRSSGSNYCYDHTCDEYGCYQEVKQFTDHCSQHQSDRDRTELERRASLGKSSKCAMCSNPVVSGSYYCSNHICKESSCKNYKVYDGYCYYHIHCKTWKASGESGSKRTQTATTSKKSSSKSGVSSKKHSGNYDSYYEDDPEAFYEDNKDLYDSFDDAMDDWEDEYGDDY